ncbi:MAG: oligosaccharide flippase family protein [Bariatricus sp.]|nr:oligosaccharide flippase family protein [Bariatricus sp.]
MGNKSIKSNIILNVIRTCCSVIFPLITFPYVSRVLGAVNYGKVNFSNSIVSYFALLAALGISNYAVREGAVLRNNKEKYNQFSNQIFTINLISTCLAYITLVITVCVSMFLRQYSLLIGIQSIAFAFTTLGVEWLYVTYEDYLYITLRSISVQVLSLILTFTLVKTPDDYVKYAFITVLSTAGANFFNYVHSRQYITLRVTRIVNWKKHLKPIFILFCHAFITTIYVNSDMTILGFLAGDYSVGIYSVAVRIYTIVKQLLNSIISVVSSRCAFYYGNGEEEKYDELFCKVIKALLTLVMPAIVGIFMLSDSIIRVIAGEAYREGAIALRILGIALGGATIACAYVSLSLLVHRKDKECLKVTFISALLNVVLNLVFIPLGKQNGAALTTLMAEIIVLVGAIYYSRDDVKVTGIKRTLISCSIGCTSIVVVCLCVSVISNTILQIAISCTVSAFVYFVLMIVLKNDVVLEGMGIVRNVLRKRRSDGV